jgi:hypothetical protein
MSEIPVHFRPRTLSDWINPTVARKVPSLIDKVFKRKYGLVKPRRINSFLASQTAESS